MIEVFKHTFVEFVPREPHEGILYVSLENAVAVHLCACGCGNKVVTPLAPVSLGWQLSFDGRTVSLTPSIGNDAFACKSHYWIKWGVVQWSYKMTVKEVEEARARNQRSRSKFYESPERNG